MTMKAATEEHHAIKIIKDMDNAILHDPIPKNVSDVCWLLTGWHNNYNSEYICTESNDGMAFTTL